MRADHAQALELFVEDGARRGLAQSTLYHRRNVASRFLRYLGDRPLAAATRDDVRGYLAVRADEIRSLSHEAWALRAFFRVVLGDGPTPMDGLGAYSRTPKLPLVLSEEGVQRLFAAASDPWNRGRGFKRKRLGFALRDRVLLELLYGLGLRCAEVTRIRLIHLDLRQGDLSVRRVKGGTHRVLPLPPSVTPHLVRYLKQGRPTLLSPARDDEGALLLSLRGGPLTEGGIYSIVCRLADLANTRVHPHAFRRAVATHLARRGAAIPTIQELLGHRALSTTAAYLTLDVQDLKRAVEHLER